MNDMGNLDKHSDTQSSAPTTDSPVYVLRRSPDMKGQSIYTIWVKEDGMKISSVKLSQLLANVLQSQVKVSEHSSSDPDTNTDSHKVAQS